MTNHAKCKGFCTNIKVSNPILCDCGRTIYHITKHFEMFTLVTTYKIKIHHEKFTLTNFTIATKSKLKRSLPWTNLINAFTTSNNGNKQNKANNVWLDHRIGQDSILLSDWRVALWHFHYQCFVFCHVLFCFEGFNIEIHQV